MIWGVCVRGSGDGYPPPLHVSMCVCVCVCARTRVYEPSPWKRLILGKVEGKRRGDEG